MDDFLPTVFDRLTDPTLAAGRARYTLAATQAHILRDLEDLLNTRRPRDDTFAGLDAVQASVANFGLRDFAHLNVNSAEEQAAFAAHIKAVVELFDPRLTEVEVTPRRLDPAAAQAGPGFQFGTIYLRIRATLALDPLPVEGVVFDTLFDVTTGRHRVTAGGAA